MNIKLKRNGSPGDLVRIMALSLFFLKALYSGHKNTESSFFWESVVININNGGLLVATGSLLTPVIRLQPALLKPLLLL